MKNYADDVVFLILLTAKSTLFYVLHAVRRKSGKYQLLCVKARVVLWGVLFLS